jgi:hypothetical protein
MIVVGTGNAPALSSFASRATSSSVNVPEISPLSVMMPWIVASELLIEEDPEQLAEVVARELTEFRGVLRLEIHLRLARLAVARLGRLQFGAGVDHRARILVRAVRIVGVLLVGIGPRTDLRRDDLELEHGRLFEQALRFVGVLDRRQLDQQPVSADLRDHGFGHAETVHTILHDRLDLVLDVGRDRRNFFGRLQLEQYASAALQVEAEVDLLLDRDDGPDAQPHDGQEEDRLDGPLELIPHTVVSGKGRTPES